MKKRLLCLGLALLLVLVFFSACKQQDNATPPSSSLPESSKDTPQNPSVLYDSNRLMLYIYTPEGTYNVIETDVADKEVDMYFIMDKLRESYAATEYFQNETFGPQGVGILEVNTIERQKEWLVIDFKSESAPVIAAGSTLESDMLASVGATFVRNVKGVQGILWRVDGKPYESGHLSFKDQEPYAPPQG